MRTRGIQRSKLCLCESSQTAAIEIHCAISMDDLGCVSARKKSNLYKSSKLSGETKRSHEGSMTTSIEQVGAQEGIELES